jgi:magnesium transporter
VRGRGGVDEHSFQAAAQVTTSQLDEPLSQHVRRDLTPLRVGQSVGEALTFLRSQELGERIVYFYVVDAAGALAGVVPTRRLLMAAADLPVERIMASEVASLPSTATLGDAAKVFLARRLLALPVTDAAGHLEGIADVSMITDELARSAARQNAEDVFQLVGAKTTLAAGAWGNFRDRFPWLLCNVGGGVVAAIIAGRYESLLDAAIVLALFIPVVLAVSESVGMQSVTLTLQRLHGAQPDLRFLLDALRRELRTAILLGAACGATVGSVVLGWKGTPTIAVAVAVTVTMAMVTASLLGVALPVAFRSARRDPRIAAGPVVLALTDFVTLLFYFNVAGWLLRVRT